MFTTNDHEFEVAFSGEPDAALEVARTALLGHGFEILEQSQGTLRATGPGVSSTKQPALCGASEITFRVRSSWIKVSARLGGVRNMKLFLWLFPPGLMILLMAVFFLAGMATDWRVWLAIAPWIVLSPIMSSAIERKTTRAIDGLARSMAQVARGG